MNFDGFIRDIVENKWNVFGVEVYEQGKLSHAWGDTETNLHEVYSATKGVLSCAVGIAWDEGRFDLTKSILYYLPEEKVRKLTQNHRAVFEKITIQRLLTMSVADFPFRAEGDSYIDFALQNGPQNPENCGFHYTNISAYLVGVALANALGRDVGSFIEERLFRPLGIDNYAYERCPEGYFYGASGLKLTVHELSRFGLLLYNRGVYDGQRILSEEYVKTATSPQTMNREGGYGYFIWKYRDGFSINGKWGQKCYILPKEGIIVASLSHREEGWDDVLVSMEKNILGINE